MIGDIAVSGNYVRIYDDSGRETNYSFHAAGTVEGWNSRRIVVRDREYATLYDDRGKQVGSSIWLGAGRSIKTVTSSAILVQEGSYVKRFDLNGQDTGETVWNP